jgi:hypothetical protein
LWTLRRFMMRGKYFNYRWSYLANQVILWKPIY